MVYIIDTENVGNGWIGLAIDEHSKNPDSKFIITYTDRTPRPTYDDLQAVATRLNGCIDFCKCMNGKMNALDFHIVAIIGILAMRNKEEKYAVISNDMGFDDAISTYRAAGVNITRIPCSNKPCVQETAQPLPEVLHPAEKTAAPAPAVRNDVIRNDEIKAYEQISLKPASESKSEPVREEKKEVPHEEKKETPHDEKKEIPHEEKKETAHETQSSLPTKQQLETLKKKQRSFLIKTCSVPGTMAEVIRHSLMKGLDATEKNILSSNAKAFQEAGKKQEAIKGIKEHYEEYTKLSW